jgi:prolyl-tRNA editing enzyme YbaK/EbsC (Cys-tRNA(Pro) deacylase)
MNVAATQIVKTLLVHAKPANDKAPTSLIALVLRGDHELNEVKADKHHPRMPFKQRPFPVPIGQYQPRCPV